MKLLTYLEEGRFRTGILTVRPDSTEPVVLGIQDAVALLEAQAARVYWRTPWAGPWGVLTAPADMLDIVAHGRQAVIALEDLERTIWHYGRTVDGGWVDALLRDPEQIQWQPPLPEPPLYIFLSGNTQVMAHQRSPNPPWQVPAARLRPITAIIGHREPLFAHDDDTAASDMELGVVIGPVAQGVGADTAMDYVFGYTVCNDTSSPVFGQKTEPFGPLTGVRMGGVATGNKGADGCGPIGPVITTADEVGSPHDLTATARFNDRVRVRAHTGAYLYNVRDTVAHFAQLMTLPAGAIIGMGACGYDGHAVQGAWRDPERNVLAVEFERVGRLEHPISYLDDPARRGVGPQGRHSRYLARREQLGLGGADRPELTASDIPAATRSFWALSENVGSTPLHKLPAPYLYPASSLAGTTTALTLPRHARRLEVSCELAGVIGPRPVFRPAPADVPDLLLGVGVIVSVIDMSLVDSFPGVPTPGTARFAAYQCRYPDGCSRIGAIIPIAGGSARLADARMTLRVGETHAAPGRVGDYGVSVEAAVAWITSGITLLPGDVVSLGPSAATLTITADEPLAAGTTLTAAIEGIGEIEIALVDQRDPSTDPWPWPLVPRG